MGDFSQKVKRRAGQALLASEVRPRAQKGPVGGGRSPETLGLHREVTVVQSGLLFLILKERIHYDDRFCSPLGIFNMCSRQTRLWPFPRGQCGSRLPLAQ